MTALLMGLVLFLGMHSARIVAEGARTRFVAQRGERAWKGLYSLVSALGLVLIVWGFASARQQPVTLWDSPAWTRPLASLLMLLSFVLVTAVYVPRNHIKARLQHPMVLGTKAWALAHLLANNTLADVLLFGGFLLWAVLAYRAARGRDRAAGVVPVAGRWPATVLTAGVGALLWAAFALWAHGPLFGVKPFA
jgi:uncharacterized membrane protein